MALPCLKKGKLSHQYVLLVIAVVILLVYGVAEGLISYLDWKKASDEKISQSQKLLTQYEEILNERAIVESNRERALKRGEEVEARLMVGETPQLGAANLQDTVRQVAEKNNIGLRSFRILEPKEIGIYRKVSLQIDFNPTYSMKSLGQFLYDLEHQDKALMISEMDLLIFNPRMANNIQGNLVVSALMKGSKAKERVKEEKGKEAKKEEKGTEKRVEKKEVKGQEEKKPEKQEETERGVKVKVKIKNEKTSEKIDRTEEKVTETKGKDDKQAEKK
ncbi:MAG: type II secretion system protein GspM [Deltaproteobacteria bacterium]|nr:type II secretion system protein GspM [Deltaproteobacteria bacterium]